MTFVLAATALILLGALVYGGIVYRTWRWYGRPARPDAAFADPLLDRFMPHYDVVERHAIVVDAPAAVTLDAAMDSDLRRSALVRGIFEARSLILGADRQPAPAGSGLLTQMKALGWGELAGIPGREIVMGAVTKPWRANVTFHALRQAEFEQFNKPGFVKIVWTLRADPLGGGRSVFRTETRARATDPYARHRFRWYWARFSPGVWLIRRLSLAPIKGAAERRIARRRPLRLAA